jgi:NAD(P)H-hydrate epimerase
MAEVDRLAVEHYRIGLMQMMENAGRELARLARAQFLGGDARRKRVAVLVGKGGNGGGALVAARHLHNWGACVEVTLAQRAREMNPIPRRQLAIVQRMGVAIRGSNPSGALGRPDLVLDGIIGYRLAGAPTGNVADLIRWANAARAPILALDLPSGLDATTGAAFDPAIRAAATLTLALPKTGLRPARAAGYVGELYLADIGIPPVVYERPELGFEIGALFARGEVLRLAQKKKKSVQASDGLTPAHDADSAARPNVRRRSIVAKPR